MNMQQYETAVKNGDKVSESNTYFYEKLKTDVKYSKAIDKYIEQYGRQEFSRLLVSHLADKRGGISYNNAKGQLLWSIDETSTARELSF